MPADHEPDDGRDPILADQGQIRSDERQRIVRELHDSASQLLAVLELQVAQLNIVAHPEARSLIQECNATIREIGEQLSALKSN